MLLHFVQLLELLLVCLLERVLSEKVKRQNFHPPLYQPAVPGSAPGTPYSMQSHVGFLQQGPSYMVQGGYAQPGGFAQGYGHIPTQYVPVQNPAISSVPPDDCAVVHCCFGQRCLAQDKWYGVPPLCWVMTWMVLLIAIIGFITVCLVKKATELREKKPKPTSTTDIQKY